MNVDALVDEVAAARGLIHDYDRRELRELVEVVAAAVRAEAVADERERIRPWIQQVFRIASVTVDRQSYYRMVEGYLGAFPDAAAEWEEVTSALAAGSVPVSFQRGSDAVTTVAPSQPVTCDCKWHNGTHRYCYKSCACPGPVPEPKEG